MILVVYPGSGSWLLPIPDPGVKKAPDPGSGSATLHVPNGTGSIPHINIYVARKKAVIKITIRFVVCVKVYVIIPVLILERTENSWRVCWLMPDHHARAQCWRVPWIRNTCLLYFPLTCQDKQSTKPMLCIDSYPELGFTANPGQDPSLKITRLFSFRETIQPLIPIILSHIWLIQLKFWLFETQLNPAVPTHQCFGSGYIEPGSRSSNLVWMPIRIQSEFRVLMNKIGKNSAENFLNIILIKNCNLLIPRPP